MLFEVIGVGDVDDVDGALVSACVSFSHGLAHDILDAKQDCFSLLKLLENIFFPTSTNQLVDN